MLPTDEMPELPMEDELTVLKARADVLGINYHPSIKLESLRSKVNAKLAKAAPAEEEESEEEQEQEQAAKPVAQTPMQKRRELKNKMMALVRVRISCLDPSKKEHEGEIFTVGNSVIPSMKKYIPYTTPDEGYHIPQMMFDQLKERMCQIFVTKTDDKGNKVRRSKMIKAFALEVLPPLTKEELAELAQRQALSRATDD
jgi:hypothetical protein